MNWRKWACEYLDFTRRDRIGIISLVLIILGVFFLPTMFSGGNPEKPIIDSAIVASLTGLQKSGGFEKENDQPDDFSRYPGYKSQSRNLKTKTSLFLFDPNTISAEQWLLLGLREKTIHTIQNYISKGGQFRKPEDLKKVYGLFPDEYERIAPFIRIDNPDPVSQRKSKIETRSAKIENYEIEKPLFKTRNYTIIDINTADTTMLIALPGIGSKLALRIINFRDKLGGFYSVDQVGETFGLTDSVFQKIKKWLKLENKNLKKININTATLEELKTHPYIRYTIANAIVSYRKEHGEFRKVVEIKNLMVITEESYLKIIPYLFIE